MLDKDIVYTPQQVTDLTLAELGRRAESVDTGVKFGLTNVDARMNPLRPSELIMLLGRPSMYKSGLAQWWARNAALKEQAGDDNRIIVYVTTEMAVEELGLYDLSYAAGMDASAMARGEISTTELKAITTSAYKRASLPLWLVGHSLARRRARQSIDMFTIERALYWVEDKMDFTPRIIFIDYLNLLDSSREAGESPRFDRRWDMSDIVKCAKDMALNLGCPVVLLAQAHRRVDDKAWKLPDMADAMETAAIEQYSDKMFSVWYPKVSYPIGTQIMSPGNTPYTVTENLLLLSMIKQKNGQARGMWPLYVDPKRNEIAMLEGGF